MIKFTLVTLLALIATATASALPRPELSPDGHCVAGEGVACSGSIIGKLKLRLLVEVKSKVKVKVKIKVKVKVKVEVRFKIEI